MGLRVGEQFLLGFRGTALPGWVRDFEERFGLGGLLLFDRDVVRRGAVRNIESPSQLGELCEEIHDLGSRPLVCVDQEGGGVRRLKTQAGFRPLPSAAEFATLDEGEARRLARESCAEMRALGIDVDLAPVVDLNTNPDNPNIGALGRSYSDDPDEVRRCVRWLNDAATEVGLGLCLKHYPGLGGADTDTHLGLADLTGTFDDEQLRLFTDLCGGLSGAAILLSHGFVRDWDADWPVSVSQVAVHRLRESLPEALLLTDDVQMQGLQRVCATVEASERALDAGVDLVCIGNNLLNEESVCAEAASAAEARAARDPALCERLEAAAGRVRARKQRAAAAPRAAGRG